MFQTNLSLVFVWKYVLKRNLMERFKHSRHICVYFGWSVFLYNESNKVRHIYITLTAFCFILYKYEYAAT